MLRGLLQLNDGEMSAPGQVSDAQVEVLTVSAPDGSQRDGVERRGMTALSGWLGVRTSEKNSQMNSAGLYDKCLREKGQCDIQLLPRLAGPMAR